MILTYKIRHQKDFTTELKKAKLVAGYAIKNRDKLSSIYVKKIGLKSAISNQILREYGRNKKCKKINKVKLIVPSQSIKFEDNLITIACLKLSLPFNKKCLKINQIEIDKEWCYISITVPEDATFPVEGWVGVDRNTTGHCAVMACTKTNEIKFLGKEAQHIHQKYKNIRKKFQRLNKLKKLKQCKRRESNITKDINHKISKKIVSYAKSNLCGIKLEQLKGIRNNKKQAKSFRYSLNSWAYYQLQTFVEYKAQLAGVTVAYIDPHYTSQDCHKCGLRGNRSGKVFKCPHCGYTSHADGNAAWNIANSVKLLVEPKTDLCKSSVSLPSGNVYNQRLVLEGDNTKGTTDSPLIALLPKTATIEPAMFQLAEYVRVAVRKHSFSPELQAPPIYRGITD